jgi:hypothetical protein
MTKRGVAGLSAIAISTTSALATLSVSGCLDTAAPGTELHDKPGLFEPTVSVDSGTVEPAPKCLFETVPGVDANTTSRDDSSKALKTRPVSGTLSLSFSTSSPYAGPSFHEVDGMIPSYGVVWIEDPARRYVKTLERWGLLFAAFDPWWYVVWTRRNCPPDTIDVVTGATQDDGSSHSLIWSGANIDGDIVPQGSYVLWFDLATLESHSVEPVQVPFELGDAQWTRHVPQMSFLKDLTLSFTPSRE